MIAELLLKNRSYRRFDEAHRIDEDTLTELISLARISPSARNSQPLKYLLLFQTTDCEKLFPSLAWAGYLKDWDGPTIGERPSAYIMILGDKRIAKSFEWDAAIACQSMLLGAVEQGLGGCMIGSIRYADVRRDFNIPEDFDIHLVLALGKPKEKVVVDDCKPGESIEYWRDGQNVHHVPKRGLDELIVKFP